MSNFWKRHRCKIVTVSVMSLGFSALMILSPLEVRLRHSGSDGSASLINFSHHTYDTEIIAVDMNGDSLEQGDKVDISVVVAHLGQTQDDQIRIRHEPPSGTRFIPKSLSLNGNPSDQGFTSEEYHYDYVNMGELGHACVTQYVLEVLDPELVDDLNDAEPIVTIQRYNSLLGIYE